MDDSANIDTDERTNFIPLQGVRARSEAEQAKIYAELRHAIMGGAFGARGRLPTERAIAEQFGAARNTVRKTMNQLADEGLIERHVGRGTFVAGNAVDQAAGPNEEYTLSELLEARLLFEPGIPDLVVERAGDEDIAMMEAYLAEMRSATSWAEFKEAKYCLHLAIISAARNRFMTFVFEQIVASRRRAGWGRKHGHPTPVAAVREAAYRDNARIVDAIKAGDAAEAQTCIRDYLLNTLSAASSS